MQASIPLPHFYHTLSPVVIIDVDDNVRAYVSIDSFAHPSDTIHPLPLFYTSRLLCNRPFKLGMRYIQRRFQKFRASSQVAEEADEPKDTASESNPTSTTTLDVIANGRRMWLPTELLVRIVSHIVWRWDLVSLCGTSRVFNVICTPLLYRVVDIRTGRGGRHGEPPSAAAQLYLYRKLEDVRFSGLLREFRITLVEDIVCFRRKECERRAHAPSSRPRHYLGMNAPYRCPCGNYRLDVGHPACPCEDYDRALGRALLSMQNLRVLSIRCEFCIRRHTHDYLFDMDMPKLVSLEFQCVGSGTKPRSSILLAPYMRDLTSLSLDCNLGWLSGPTHSLRHYIRQSQVFPNLRILSLNGTLDFDHHLLATRPIERLCLREGHFSAGFGAFHESISERLSHLFTRDILHWLPAAMAHNLKPYRHLRYLGSIRYPKDRELLGVLEAIMPLIHLEFLEINRFDTVHPMDGAKQMLTQLGQQNATLIRVLVVYRTKFSTRALTCIPPVAPCLWEKLDGEWEERLVPQFDFWDIINDKMDEI